MSAGKVTFVGAGPGAPDLITLRGANAIAAADLVIWASSLVHPGVLVHARDGAEVVDSAGQSYDASITDTVNGCQSFAEIGRAHV